MTVPRILIRPPLRPSAGAWTLRRALGDNARISRRDSPVSRRYTHVINWGNSNSISIHPHQRLYNKPEAVAIAVNKLLAFDKLKENGVNVPEYTTSLGSDRDGIYLARLSLTGSGGVGIEVIRPGEEEVPRAPLYVKYIPKVKEYRAHVMNGEVILLNRKRGRYGSNRDRNQNLIRNHENGWVFALTTEDDQPSHIKEEAINAVRYLGLDFGAVDVIEGRDDGKAYVLEVNCAPGLTSPSAIDAYTGGVHKLTQ